MGQLNFKSVLWLDDMRSPQILGIRWVKNYVEFVDYLKNHEMPDLICFDHDLALEHYPLFENRPGLVIPYSTYKEKTGKEAAEYIVENNLPLKYWSVHTMNAQGRINIEGVLRAYRPQGELRGLQIPYRVIEKS